MESEITTTSLSPISLKTEMVCIWPLAFIVAGIITQLLIGLAVNSGNNAALGASNLMGMQYFWMIGLALWVIISSALLYSALIGKWRYCLTNGKLTTAIEAAKQV